jgi:2-polyprenyl-3-methyl-5-hydroxy-6-metoxy-1,4-benzoquinol methylase
MGAPDIEKLLDSILADYRVKPVDLLGIGDGEGECRYLMNARVSYLRTLVDVVAIIDKGLIAGSKILELGAYLGVVSIALTRLGFRVTPADIPEYMQNNRLIEKYRCEGMQTITCNLSNYHIPADSGTFDMVIMCETLEHLNFNPLPVLAEINRVLVDGGKLYLSLPNLASLTNRIKLLFGLSIHNPVEDFTAQLAKDDNMIVGIHWREYTRAEISKMLTVSGFSMEKHYFFTSTDSHPLARVLYRFIPGWRPNQTAIAVKKGVPAIKGRGANSCGY